MKKDLISTAILFWVILLVLLIKNENTEKILVGLSLLGWLAHGIFHKEQKTNKVVVTGTKLALFHDNYKSVFKPIKLQAFMFKLMFKGKPVKQNYLAWGLMGLFGFAFIFTILGLEHLIKYPVYLFGLSIAVISLLSGWIRFRQWLQINKMAYILKVTPSEVIFYLNNHSPEDVRPTMI